MKEPRISSSQGENV